MRMVSLSKSMSHLGDGPAAPRLGPAPGNSIGAPATLFIGPGPRLNRVPTVSPTRDALAQLHPFVCFWDDALVATTPL